MLKALADAFAGLSDNQIRQYMAEEYAQQLVDYKPSELREMLLSSWVEQTQVPLNQMRRDELDKVLLDEFAGLYCEAELGDDPAKVLDEYCADSDGLAEILEAIADVAERPDTPPEA